MKISKLVFSLVVVVAALPAAGKAQGLHLTTGSYLIANGAPSLVLNNTGLTHDGTFIPDSSTVLFTGDAPSSASFINGEAPINLYNLSINKTSGDVELNNDMVVTGMVGMTAGNLRLNTHTLDLGTTGIIFGERESSHITGTTGGMIRVTALLMAPNGINPGNIGVEVSSQASLGWTTITRGHVQQANQGIQRFFEFVPQWNTGLNASLHFYYLESELAGANKADLAVFSKENDMNAWIPMGRENADPDAHWIAKGGIAEVHKFTLAVSHSRSNSSGESLATSAIRIAPNPSAGIFRMIIVSGQEEDRIVRLFDPEGHLLQYKVVHCISGTNSIEWNVMGLAQGVYHLAVDGSEGVAVEIIK